MEQNICLKARKENNKHLLDETESNMQFIASGQGNIGRSEAEPNIILYGRNQLDVGRGQVQEVFYYTEKNRSNKLVVWKRLVSTKVTNLNRLSKATVSFIMFAAK